MPSSSCRLHGSKSADGREPSESDASNRKFTMSKIPKVQQVTAQQISSSRNNPALDSDRIKAQDNAQRQDRWQLKQWHKLMDDYERLQFVASSRAHNKLVDSTSESSINSSISRASTVFETSERLPSCPIREARVLSNSVSQCLHELVDSVATSSSDQQVAVPDKVFSLHEAVLAKTNSSSSAANTSEEDGNLSSCDDEAKSNLSLRGILIELVDCIELDSRNSNQMILSKARELSRNLITSGTKLTLAFDSAGNSIECFDENNNRCESLRLALVAECLQDDHLVVWLLRASSHDQQNDSSSAGLDLDDIALALNEPVPVKRSESLIQARISKALVWRCSRGLRDAKRLQDIWLQHQIKLKSFPRPDPLRASEQSNLIEIRPNEMTRNSAMAAHLKSSGLFVRGTEANGTCRKSLSNSNNVSQSIGSPEGIPRKELISCEKSPANNSSSVKESCSKYRSILKGSKLARTSLEHQQDEPINQQNHPNLANYYRSVASKVFSNGSSKLKSLTLESGQTLARGAKRLSMALNQQQAGHQAGSSTTGLNQEGGAKISTKPPKAKPRTSILKSGTPIQKSPPDDPGECNNTKQLAKRDQLQQVDEERDGRLQSKRGPIKSPVAGVSRCVSSDASRARQRRPALLLTHSGATHMEPSGVATANITNPQTDGTVRAQVGASHLRRSASMKVLAAAHVASESPAELGHVDEKYQGAGDGRRPQTRKKSEFDPRSLRKLSCSETARALRRRDSEIEASDRRHEQLIRDRVRRRKSLANLAELKPALDVIEIGSVPPADPIENDPAERQKQFSGFSLLRQSFKQRSLSRTLMSVATSRHSMRMKRDHHIDEVRVGQEEEATHEQPQKSSSARHNRLEALQVAEVNLQAARQLKQQVQLLREQQRRNEQQQPQQASPIGQDQAAAILLYNQQVQMQKHHQQQLIYQAQQMHQQQQFAAFSNGFTQHVLDPLALYHQSQQHTPISQQHQQQQFQFQQNREHSQQVAYLSNPSAHFMAAQQKHQQLALVQTPAPSLGLASMLLGGQPAFSLEHNQPSSLISRQQQRTCLANYQPQQLFPSPPAYLTTTIDQQQQQQQKQKYQQQFVPMSVNHHSSLKIVYTAAAAAAAVANQQQHLLQQQQMAAALANQHQLNQLNLATPFADQLGVPVSTNQSTTVMQQHQFLADLVATTEPCQSPAAAQASFRSKHNTLGASVRRTMRSILRNGKSVAEYAISSAGMSRASAQTEPMIVMQQQAPSKPLKSALKSSSSNRNEQQHNLNSEGSDGSSSISSSSSLSSNDSFHVGAQAVTSSCRNKKDAPKAKYSTASGSSTRSSLASTLSTGSSTSSASDSSLVSTSDTLQDSRAESDKTMAACGSSDSSDEQHDKIPAQKRRIEAQRRSLCARPAQAVASSAIAANQRKNVTFSTKLTSIL